MTAYQLAAILTLDSSAYDKGLGKASEDAKTFGQKIGDGLKTAAKVGGAAIAAAATAVGSLVKNSIESYGEYEQLVGGVETLFGAGGKTIEEYAESVGKTVSEISAEYNTLMAAQEAVMANAANAYQTAGLSANEYMETVTSFSASLLQSLGGDTEAAASYADMAITDMSDNANKMGTSMEAIQNAYQGFAKQNYTMLDNLKLGYGGTKTEMERLITDAEALDRTFAATRDENGDLAMSYADIVDAIHIVQDNMGITGTTAKEASTTIQGSVNSMKSAWTNLVTGMADDNADFGGLVNNFVDSVVTVGQNIIPRLRQALSGVGKLVTELAPVISQQIPVLISDILPSLLQAGASLVSSVGQAIVENLPMLIDTAYQLVLTLAQGLGESLPEIIPAVVGIITQIITSLTDPANLNGLVDAAINIIIGLADGLIAALPVLIEAAPTIITNLLQALITNIPRLLVAGVDMVVSLAEGIISSISQIAGAAGELIMSFLTGIAQYAGNLVQAGVDIYQRVKDGIIGVLSGAAQWGRDLINNFVNGIKQGWANLKSAVTSTAQTIRSLLHFSEPDEGPLADFHTYAPDMMRTFAQGIRDNENVVRDQIARSFDFGDSMVNVDSSLTSGASGESRVASLLNELLEQLDAGLPVVLDDGTLVGRLAPRINRALWEAY